MEMKTQVYESIFNDKIFNDTIEILTYNQFLSSHKHPEGRIKIEFSSIKKCVWLSSILAGSDNENHRRKVQLFAMLSHLAYNDNPDIERTTFLLLSRIGNLTASRHLPNYKNINNKSDQSNLSVYDGFDVLLNYELAEELNNKTIHTEDESILATQFQKDLWDKLNQNTNLSVSAPTSAGKSFIIKKYIKAIQRRSQKSNYIYIVPSRALINQVSEEFRLDFGEGIDIRTSFLEPPEIDDIKNHLYILTAERCLKLIQYSYDKLLDIDLIFVDEIQNIEDEKGRGTILEFVLEELSILYSQAQIIIAGPNISNNQELFQDIFSLDAASAKTALSPVFQIKTIIKPIKDKTIQVLVKPLPHKALKYELEVGFDLGKRFTAGIGHAITDVVNYFAPNQSSIIFSARSDYAELWARKYIETNVESDINIEDETQELIDFLGDEVHPSYYLIECLKHKIAFHHSKLPDIVRKEIEDGFLNGRITKLYCTTTLIEGVNLPASNLFIVSPKILGEELSDFRFGNLIGRAGRLKDSLYGTIYCIERNATDEWAEEFYDKTYSKEVVSASDKAIKSHDNFQQLTLSHTKDIKEKGDKNTLILIRQKFLKNPDELKTYLQNKKIPQQAITTIIENTSSVLKDIKLPYGVIRKNPSIDPILQEQLYNSILDLGIEKWCIHINRNFESRIKTEDVTGPYETWSFFWQFADLLQRLDTIFEIWKEVKFDLQIDISTRQMASYAVRWTSGESYRKLIREDINFMARHLNPEKRIDINDKDAINKRINTVIKINSVVVSHVLVKYTKLLNDILDAIMTEDQRTKFKFSLALPTMLELGTRSTAVHLLISRGVARSIAMKVFDIFKKVQGHETMNILEWLEQQQSLDLKPIYKRYLHNLKLVPLLQ